MSEDPDWGSNPGRPNGYKKGEEKILCFKELCLGLEAFLVLGRLLEKNSLSPKYCLTFLSGLCGYQSELPHCKPCKIILVVVT